MGMNRSPNVLRMSTPTRRTLSPVCRRTSYQSQAVVGAQSPDGTDSAVQLAPVSNPVGSKIAFIPACVLTPHHGQCVSPAHVQSPVTVRSHSPGSVVRAPSEAHRGEVLAARAKQE